MPTAMTFFQIGSLLCFYDISIIIIMYFSFTLPQRMLKALYICEVSSEYTSAENF